MWLPLTSRMRRRLSIPGDPFQHLLDPGAGGIDQGAGVDRAARAGLAADELGLPAAVDRGARRCRRVRVRITAPRSAASSAFRTTRRASSTQQSEYSNAFAKVLRSGRPSGAVRKVERARAGQPLAAAEMVVEEQAEADQPGRALLRAVRQHEAHRPDDVRGRGQQHLALDQRLAHQPELVVLEIAQAAMHQLAAARRGARGEVVLLAQQHRQAAAGGIARDAGAVDAAADDQEVDGSRLVPIVMPLGASVRLLAFGLARPGRDRAGRRT